MEDITPEQQALLDFIEETQDLDPEEQLKLMESKFSSDDIMWYSEMMLSLLVPETDKKNKSQPKQ